MFRLAHLSDPHLGPLPEARLAELASKRMLGYLNWRLNRGRGSMRSDVLDAIAADIQAQGPDHVAVTGDLVNIALDAELEPARRWLASLGPGPRVSVVPGNHDAYVPGALKRASDSWGAYLWGDDSEHVRFPYVRKRGPVALVGASSATATGPFMATGLFDASQGLRLEESLEHLRHKGLFRVVMIHHPPSKGATNWAARLVGAERFRAIIRRVGAELILHGHTHRASLDWVTGPNSPVPVVGVPSASRQSSPDRRGAGWNLFEIEGGPGDWVIHRVERGFAAGGAHPEEISRQRIQA